MAEGRDPVEVLAEDFIQRRRGGEDVSIEGYAQEHPELATQIRELFPALLFMETQSGEDEDDAIGSPPPEQFGSYRILEEIGHGGMGRVYLALDSKLDRQIALKLLPEKFSDDAMRAAMFGREAKTAAHLNHPNIATVHEMGEVDRRHFIAMEYVAGRSLGELLLGREPLSLEDLLPIAIQIAEGLGAAHKQNIIHRDLKPANIMLTEEGRVKILDFGLAKALGGEVGKLGSGGESLNTSEVIVGTPGYMSPEQARGEALDARTDLFSLGVVLYEMATGIRAFHRTSVADTFTALLTEDPQGVTTVNPKMPVGLERLIGKLLEKRVEDRFGSAVEVLEELQALVPGRVSKSRRFLRVAMGVAALVVAGVALVWVFGSKTLDPRFAELELLIQNSSIQPARVLLADLYEDWGREDETCRGLDGRLRARIDELLSGDLDSVINYLAMGETAVAKKTAKSMERLDRDCEMTARAGRLIIRADSRQAEIGKAVEVVLTKIDVGQFAEAYDLVEPLDRELFEGKNFRPAREAAKRLKAKLIQQLIVVGNSLETLHDPSDGKMRQLEEVIAVLGKLESQSNRLVTYKEKLAELQDAKELQLLADEAEANEDSSKLREIVTKMEGLGPDSPLTKNAAGRFDKYRSLDEAIQVFEDDNPSLIMFRSAVDRLEEFAQPNEFEPFKRAEAWLGELKGLEGQINREEIEGLEASLESQEKEIDGLPSVLLAAAQSHQTRLEKAFEVQSHRVDIRRQIAGIKESILRRCLEEARENLAKLEEEAVSDEFSSDINRLNVECKALADDEEEDAHLRDVLDTYRSQLKNLQLTNAERTFRELDIGWRKSRDRLNQSLDVYEDEPNLRLERAELYLWLGDDQLAEKDADLALRIEPSLRGYLLRGQARFMQERYLEALDDFSAAISIDDESGEAHLWRGICKQDQIEIWPDQRTETLTEKRISALSDFENAIGMGINSCFAYYSVASICVKLDRYDKAIDAGRNALTAPFTEADILANLRGYKNAWILAKFVRCEVHCRIADAYLQKVDYLAVIKECTAALDENSGYGLAYAIRGYAYLKNGQTELARDDCSNAEELAEVEEGNDLKNKVEQLKALLK